MTGVPPTCACGQYWRYADSVEPDPVFGPSKPAALLGGHAVWVDHSVGRRWNSRFRFYELTREQYDVMMERFRRGSLASRTT